MFGCAVPSGISCRSRVSNAFFFVLLDASKWICCSGLMALCRDCELVDEMNKACSVFVSNVNARTCYVALAIACTSSIIVTAAAIGKWCVRCTGKCSTNWSFVREVALLFVSHNEQRASIVMAHSGSSSSSSSSMAIRAHVCCSFVWVHLDCVCMCAPHECSPTLLQF